MEHPPKYTADNLTTIQSFILQEARRHPNASGEFSWLLSAIALALAAVDLSCGIFVVHN